MTDLLIATGNPGKRMELQALLAGMDMNLVLPKELGIQLDVEENGTTYAENAEKKARAYCQASGLLTLADDSGLEVDALNGEPGLHSARYAPWPDADDADRRRYLLQNLAGVPGPWTARFRCVAVITAPGGLCYFSEGVCEGIVIDEERGANGFGYDPIFLLPELGLTMAQLPSEEKNRLSHRARAIQGAIPILKNIVAK